MPAVDLTPYIQPQGTTSDGTKLTNLLTYLQSTLNALDDANIAPGAAIALSKLATNPLGRPLALTGATAATRYVGATASGAPASGTFAVADFSIDQTGKVFVCTVAGTPGTWVQVGANSVTAPIAKIRQNVLQSLTNGAWTKIVNLATVDFDTDTMSGTANQLTVTTAGKYLLIAELSDASANANYAVRIKQNSTVIAQSSAPSGPFGTTTVQCSVVQALSATDAVTFEGWNTDTGAHNTNPALTWLSASKLA